MSILVVCRGCHKRFKVSDKFAGKKGTCPNGKEPITVPGADEEVTIHTPEHSEGGARGKDGELVLKPVSREDHALSGQEIGIIAAVAVGVFVVALLLRFMSEGAQSVVGSIGTVVLAPPLVLGAYRFLRNDELEAYSGQAQWTRVAICSVVYAGTWGLYALLPTEYTSETHWWVILAPLFLAIGITASYACFDLEPLNAFFHYACYIAVTLLLAITMGMQIITPPETETPPAPNSQQLDQFGFPTNSP